MKKTKLFIENFLIYGFGGVIGRIIPIIMLPLITRLMPETDYFGLNDLTHTFRNFGQQLAVMGMYDAMFRMFFEKEDDDYKKRICSTAFTFTMATSLLIFVVILICQTFFADFVFSDKQYTNLVMLTAMSILVGGTNSIVSAPTRMQNKRGVYLILNTVAPVLSYAISIPLLLKGYYAVALPLAAVITAVLSEATFWTLNKKWFDLRKFDFESLKALLKIALPLLPNMLIYWVFNSSDRLMVAKIIGNDAAGMYAIGAKLGLCSQLIYTAFAGGWQYFAFATMREKDQVRSNSMVYEYLGQISFVASAFVAALSYPIYRLLFEGDYVNGYVVSAYLFLAPLLQMLFQVAANQFLVIKKTWPNALFLCGGAVFNVTLNFILIPRIGIEGAAIATLIGYLISNVACVAALYKIKLIVLSKRFYVSAACMAAFIVIWRMFFRENWGLGLLFAVAFTAIVFCLYGKDCKLLLAQLKRKKAQEENE